MEIAIAAKSREIRSALKLLISQSGNKDKITEPVDFIDLLKKIKNQKIRLVIIDWEFFNGDTVDLVTLFKKAYKDINFIVLGLRKKDQKAAQDANIDAFYLKSGNLKELVNVITKFRNK